MKVQTYNQKELPAGESGQAFSMPGERRTPIERPMKNQHTAEAAIKLADTVVGIEGKMAEARRADQYNTAVTRARVELTGLIQKYQDPNFIRDTDPKDYPAIYAEDRAKIREKVLAGVEDPKALNQAGQAFDYLGSQTEAKVLTMGRSLEIDQMTDNYLKSIKQQADMAILGGTGQGIDDVATSLAEIERQIAGAQAAGIRSADQAKMDLERAQAYIGTNIWASAIAKDPVNALARLEKGKLGYMTDAGHAAMLTRARNAVEALKVDTATADARAAENAAYADLLASFPDDPDGAIMQLRDPKYQKEKNLDVRQAASLITIFNSQKAQAKAAKDAELKAGRDAEHNGIANAMIGKDYVTAARLVKDAKHLDPSTRLVLDNAINATVKAQMTMTPAKIKKLSDSQEELVRVKIRYGEITNRDQILEYVSRGLEYDRVGVLEKEIKEEQQKNTAQENWYARALDMYGSWKEVDEDTDVFQFADGTTGSKAEFGRMLNWMMDKEGIPKEDPRVLDLAQKLREKVGQHTVPGDWFGDYWPSTYDQTLWEALEEAGPYSLPTDRTLDISSWIDQDILDATPEEVGLVKAYLDGDNEWKEPLDATPAAKREALRIIRLKEDE